jgi:hypothetical protein
VVCYNVLHFSQKAVPTLFLECYALRKHVANKTLVQQMGVLTYLSLLFLSASLGLALVYILKEEEELQS